MAKKTKTTKKYELSRADIADRLERITDRLSEINTVETSPLDVGDELGDIVSECQDLADAVINEA